MKIAVLLGVCFLLVVSAGASYAQWSFTEDFQKPYPFQEWEGKVATEGDELVIAGGDKGGLVMRFKGAPIDLSVYENHVPHLVGRRGRGFGDGASAFSTLRLYDADGTSINLRINNWGFPASGDNPKAIAFESSLSDATIRDAGDIEGFDYARVDRLQLLGNWSDNPYRMSFAAFGFEGQNQVEPGVVEPGWDDPADETAASEALADFSGAFAYGDWKGKAQVADGRLSISAGDRGGVNLPVTGGSIDLSGRLEERLTLTGRRGSGYNNQSAYFVTVELRDADKTTRRHRFKTVDLPTADEPVATIVADVPLSQLKPGKPGDDGEMDWSKVSLVEVKGNWSDKKVDLELAAVGVVAGGSAKASQISAAPGPDDPRVVHLGLVGPNTLGVTIRAQRTVLGKQIPYEAQPGDRVDDGHHRWLTRDGKTIGTVVGRQADTLFTLDDISGRPLDVEQAVSPTAYHLVAEGESEGISPVAVHRKTKPFDESRMGTWAHAYPLNHVLYLEFDQPLDLNAKYELAFEGFHPTISTADFLTDLKDLRSEAVHASHIGFRPDDRVKVGYLSLWMGDGGPQNYAAGTAFWVIDELDAKVFEGQAELSLGRDETEAGRGRNYSLTDVYRLDFSGLRDPGTYRLVVDGVGCSYPFIIGEDVWKEAFKVAMTGLLHHRSGIELGPPFTDYVRPRTMVPGGDGFDVIVSDTPMLKRDGSTLGQRQAFDRLVEHETTESVPQAWGGYMDAGDWDRRVQHLFATRLLLELYERNPDYFNKFSLNLPPTEQANGLPDILDEAVFNLDLYLRLQQSDGGVRGWIESANHPRYGETSWQESQSVFATEADPYASYLFAATAARFARVAEDASSALAAEYAAAAERAFDWSEAELIEGDWNAEAYTIRDARNLAAVELYRLKGQIRFHEVFLATTAFDRPRPKLQDWKKFHQREAAAVYIGIDQLPVDDVVYNHTKIALVAEADDRAAMTMETGFGWTNDRMGWVGWGQQSALVNSLTLVRAHMLTGDDRYLAAIQRAVQFAAGANPMNIALTTGVGHDWPRHPLHTDSYLTGQQAPTGITIYGPTDEIPRGPDQPLYWATKKMHEAGAIYPNVRTWPALESHWDIKMHPASSEYTIMQTIGPNVYLWGYLASYDTASN